MKKMLFVINPNSGKGQIRTHLLKIIDTFVKHDYEVMVHPTQARYDAHQIVLSRGSEFDIIVCSGGDGTLNETIKGIMSLDRKIPLGYIPSGTMNDFAASHSISRDMPTAAERICTGTPLSIDVGAFNNEYFTYIAAFGAFTDVSYETPQHMKNMFGQLAYIMEGVKRVNAFKSFHITVKNDDIFIEDDFIFGMVSNSNSVGGMKGLSGNDVLLDDGIFEVFLIKMPQNLIELQVTVNKLLKRELSSDCFYNFKADKLEFHSDDELPWSLDGEFGGNCRNVTIINKCCAIDIIADSSGNTANSNSSEEYISIISDEDEYDDYTE